MNWQQVCEDKTLHNLPYKIELEVLSPCNTITEMDQQRALYFDNGAEESFGYMLKMV